MLSIRKNLQVINRLFAMNFTRRVEREKRIKKSVIGLFKMSPGPQPLESLAIYTGNVITTTTWTWDYQK